MSQLGAHLSLGPRNGFGAALQQCAEAGSPVPVLFAFDQNVWPDVQADSPKTILVYRTTVNASDNPPAMYAGDPIGEAENWYAALRPKWLLNPAHYYAPSNERNPTPAQDAAQDAWIDQFDLRLMQLADRDGLKLAIHGDSYGTPDYAQWKNYRASLAYAAQHGHILALHEPAWGAPDLALRYRKVHDLIQPFAPNLKMVISECYGDDNWFASLAAYDAEAMQDAYLIGFAAYQLGGDENWQALIPDWANYVATHPTPSTPPVEEWVFRHWVDAASGEVVATGSVYEFALLHDASVRAVFEKKAPPPVTLYSFQWSAEPPELAGRVTSSHPAGEYAAGTTIRLEAR